MYAIIDIVGQQFKVEKNTRIFAHRLEGKEGDELEFDKVMLIDNDGKVIIGTPFLKNALVTAKIISHLKGDKIKVFKKKRRKGYQVLNGHRQYFTELEINDIFEQAPDKKVTAKAKAGEKPEKTEPAKDTVEKETAPKATAAKTGTKAKTEQKPAEEKAEEPKEKSTKKTTTAKSAAKPKTTATTGKKPAQAKKASTKKTSETKGDKKVEEKAKAKPTKKAEEKPEKDAGPDSTKE
jgi:large subunit ribosomal protein L21